VLINRSRDHFDEITRIPYARFNREGVIPIPGKPFRLSIKKFYRNSRLRRSQGSDPAIATQGIGTQIAVVEAPPVFSDEETNVPSAYIEVRESGKSLGTWLVSAGLGAPQTFESQGTQYQMALRPVRYYYPFQLTLKDFTHDRYPGTDIPKNFSSLVHLSHPQKKESRDVLIYMNHPLRYEGKTFYQASFGKNDTLSVLQVVENPVWVTPYVSCALVLLGLAIQFLMHLLAFWKKEK